MKAIAIVAFDKFTDIDVFLACGLFNRTRLLTKNMNVKIIGSKHLTG